MFKDIKMENIAGKYRHLERDEEGKHRYLFLHSTFLPAGPVTMSFDFQNYSMVALKGTPVASVWQHPGPHAGAFSLYIVMCSMVDTIPSGVHCARSLHANCWLRAPGNLQNSRKGDLIQENSLLPGTYKVQED